jgi:predicted ATP-dependent serine protease
LGLTGRLRAAAQAERRLDECAKLGIATAVVPEGTRARNGHPRILAAETLRAALRAGLEAVPRRGEHEPAEATIAA